MNSEPVSVSQYLDNLNSKLKTEKAKIVGEISGVQMYEGRSYLYFSIKDSKDGSTAKCFMWKRDFILSGVELNDGIEVIITAYPNIYKPNGGLTLQVELLELVGEGALKIAYDKLKQKLELEGLFANSRKKIIPDYPHRIGVITSKSGAVINDFLSNIGKFGYEILFMDSKVEGQDAIRDLLSAVETLKKKDLDVLVIMRGGGSLESFMAFNNEMLVRAVADFPVPVLTGIGHDKDAPLVSMVSDMNVSTPTAVANLLNSTWNNALSKIRLSEIVIENSFTNLLNIFHRAEEILINAVSRIEIGIQRGFETIALHSRELSRGFSLLTTNTLDFLIQSEKTILLSSPDIQLSKGYSIVRHNGKVLRSIKSTKKGDMLDISVSDGIIQSKVI